MLVGKMIIFKSAFVFSFITIHMVMTVSMVPSFATVLDVSDSIRPPGSPVGAPKGLPQIVMEYNNKEYDGALRTYMFEHGDVDPNVQTNLQGPGPNLTYTS